MEDILPSELPGISIASGLGQGRREQAALCEAPVQVQGRTGKGSGTDQGGSPIRRCGHGTRLAHTVKGVSGNLGGESLYRAAAELEKAIKEGKEAWISHDRVRLSVEGRHGWDKEFLRQALAAQQGPEKSAAEVHVDKEAVKTLLQEIAQLLESDLTEAMNRLEALNHHLANSSVYEEFKRLEKQVESFDTDSALKSVETIASKLEIEL